MMRLISLFFFLFFLSHAEVVDFGIQGRQYPILEENGIDFIKRRIKEIDKKKIENTLKEEVYKLAKSSVVIPTSYSDTNVTKKDVYLAKWDIVDPITKELLYAKGEPIPTDMQKGKQLELCFIDGHLQKAVLENIITTFGRKCTYFVNNKDVFEFEKEFNVSAYPMGGQNLAYLNRYEVKVLPTKITRFLDKKIVRTLNVKRIALEVLGEGSE